MQFTIYYRHDVSVIKISLTADWIVPYHKILLQWFLINGPLFNSDCLYAVGTIHCLFHPHYLQQEKRPIRMEVGNLSRNNMGRWLVGLSQTATEHESSPSP